MTIVLGLDVSTSCTGVCVLNSEVEPIEGRHILLLDRIEFKGCETLFDKADCVKRFLEEQGRFCVERVVVEEPLMGFRKGMSSAKTITQLMRFNGIISYLARNIFGCEPEYIGSGHARKLCGIKLQRTKEGGSQKEQAFRYFAESELKHVVWPLKKNGNQVDWSRDATDSYCIARAACIEKKIK